jgi:hypothetical protein
MECEVCNKKLSRRNTSNRCKEHAIICLKERVEVIKKCLCCEKEFSVTRVIIGGKPYVKKKEPKCCSSKCAHTRILTKESRDLISKKLKNNIPWIKGKKLPRKIIPKYCIECKKELYKVNTTGYCQTHLFLRKDLMSEINKKSYREGRNFVAGGTTKWHSYKNIKVQGTYELRTCYYLDYLKENKKILDWEYTNDRYPYIDVDGKERTYLLDFKVFTPNQIIYIETKGRVIETDYLKWRAVKDLGYIIKIWKLKDIKKREKWICSSKAEQMFVEH